MADTQALYRRTLQRAVGLLGGVESVALSLALDARTVRAMLDGTIHIPEWVFLAAVDAVISHDLVRTNHEPVARPAERDEDPPPPGLSTS